MDIRVCVGSSCFIEDSNRIIKYLEEQIEKYDLKQKIVLSACLCMNNCINRINISVDGVMIEKVDKTNIQQLFEERILKQIEND